MVVTPDTVHIPTGKQISIGSACMPASRQNRTFEAQLTEADTDSIDLPPYDTASAGGAKIIEAQGKRFGDRRRGREIKTRAVARDVAHDAIDQRRLVVEHDPGALEHGVSHKLATFFHGGVFLSPEPYAKPVAYRLK